MLFLTDAIYHIGKSVCRSDILIYGESHISQLFRHLLQFLLDNSPMCRVDYLASHIGPYIQVEVVFEFPQDLYGLIGIGYMTQLDYHLEIGKLHDEPEILVLCEAGQHDGGVHDLQPVQ